MKKVILLAVVALFAVGTEAQIPAATSAADQLGWQLAVHSYTFKNFSIFDAIDKTAALGVHYMSISGSVNWNGSNSVATTSLSEKQLQAIQDKLKASGISPKFVNIGVVKLPPDEATSRKVFEFAKKLGIDTLVAEPATNANTTSAWPVTIIPKAIRFTGIPSPSSRRSKAARRCWARVPMLAIGCARV